MVRDRSNSLFVLRLTFKLMKKIIFTLLAIAAMGSESFAQEESRWKNGLEGALQGSYTSFSTYYSAGGTPSLTILGNAKAHANYKIGKHSWDNEFIGQLGALRQGKLAKTNLSPLIKNVDIFNLNTKYGYELRPKLNLAAYTNFNTQVLKGFDKPADPLRNLVSNFLSPAKVDMGIGLEWKPNDNFSILYAPINGRLNVVNDLALRPSLGNVKNEMVKFELGSFLNAKFKRDLWTVKDGDKVKDWPKLTYSTSLIAFMGYLQYKNAAGADVGRPFNPDITLWSNSLNFRVNKFLTVNYLLNLQYDDDIKFKIQDANGNPTGAVGPRTQFTQVFGVGLAYNWSNKK
jgi:Protein of unknown function (DUF3078)